MRHLLVFAVLLSVPGWAQESSSVPDKAASNETAKVPVEDAVSPEVAKAEQAIVKSDWKTAEPLLDSWLAQHPRDTRALFDLGYVADAQGRYEDALSQYQKALAENPKNFDAQVSLGLLLARMGKAIEARPALEAATSMPSETSEAAAKAKAWRALAEIDLDGLGGKPDPAQASIDLLEALKLSPESTSDTLLAARIAESSGDEATAEAAYRRVLAKVPDTAAASAGLAHSLIAQKKYPEAEELLKAALEKSPENPALTAQLAAVLVAQDKAEALPLLQQFHARQPNNAALTRMLAQVLADAGEYAESDQLYMTLLAAQPRDPDLLSGHGQNLIRQHQYPEALKAFQSATAIDETNGEAWSGLAFAAFQTHQPEITLHALTMRSKYLPENATIYFLWATAYDTLHDKKQASAYYHHFLESSAGKLPDQEWQAKERLKLLEKAP